MALELRVGEAERAEPARQPVAGVIAGDDEGRGARLVLDNDGARLVRTQHFSRHGQFWLFHDLTAVHSAGTMFKHAADAVSARDAAEPRLATE